MGDALGIPTYGVCSLDALGRRRRAGCWSPPTRAGVRSTGRVYADGVRVDRAGGGPAGRRRRGDRATAAVGEGALYSRGPRPAASTTGCSTRPAPRWSRWPPTGSAPTRPASRSPRSTCAAPTPSSRPARKTCCHDRAQRFRWWHIAEVLPIEEDLFGAEQWSAAHVLERAGQRPLLPGRARTSEEVRRLRAAWPSSTGDEAWVQNIAVRRDAQRRGSAGSCWRRCWPRPPAGRTQGAAGGRGRQRTRPSGSTPPTGSSRSACAAATTSPATPTPW